MSEKELIQVINKAIEDIGKIIDYPHVIISCNQFFPELQRIQDDLAGAIEDRMVE